MVMRMECICGYFGDATTIEQHLAHPNNQNREHHRPLTELRRRHQAAGAPQPGPAPRWAKAGPDRPSDWGRRDWALLGLLTLLGLASRFYDLGRPDSAVYDETHIGRFVNGYASGKYFFDVHPPLAKLLYYQIGQTLGYAGPAHCRYSDPGSDPAKLMETDRNERCDMKPLRSVAAGLGSLLVPLIFLSGRELGLSTTGAGLASGLLLVDNLFLVMSRIHMNDIVYMSFLGMAVLCASKVQRAGCTSRSVLGWLWLTGLSLGAALTSRYLMVLPLLAWIGLQNAAHMLTRLPRGPLWVLSEGVLRVSLLLLLPLAIYIGMYLLHLSMLPQLGSGSGYMSPQFRLALEQRSSGLQPSMGALEMVWELTLRQHQYHQEMAIVFPPGKRPGGGPD